MAARKATAADLRASRETREVYIAQIDATVTVRSLSQGEARKGLAIAQEFGEGSNEIIAYWLRMGLADPELTEAEALTIIDEGSVAVLNAMLSAVMELNAITPIGSPEPSAVEAAEGTFPGTAEDSTGAARVDGSS